MEQNLRYFISLVIDYGQAMRDFGGYFLLEPDSPFVKIEVPKSAGVTKVEYPTYTAMSGVIPQKNEIIAPLGSYKEAPLKKLDYTWGSKAFEYYHLAYPWDTRGSAARELPAWREKNLWQIRSDVISLIESDFATLLSTDSTYESTHLKDCAAAPWSTDTNNPIIGDHGLKLAFDQLYIQGTPATDIIFGHEAWVAFFRNKIVRQMCGGNGYGVEPGAPKMSDIETILMQENYNRPVKIHLGLGANYTQGTFSDSDEVGTLAKLWGDMVVVMHQPKNKTFQATVDINARSATVQNVGSAADLAFAAYCLGDETTEDFEEPRRHLSGSVYSVAGGGMVLAKRCGFKYENVAA